MENLDQVRLYPVDGNAAQRLPRVTVHLVGKPAAEFIQLFQHIGQESADRRSERIHGRLGFMDAGPYWHLRRKRLLYRG